TRGDPRRRRRPYSSILVSCRIMPRPTDYTRARRIAMQATMWLILGGTVALAAVVVREKRREHRVELAEEVVTVGDIAMNLPKNWRARPHADDDPRLIAQAVEGEAGMIGPRTIKILHDRLEDPISPLQ